MSLIAAVQTNLLGQIRDTAPANAPRCHLPPDPARTAAPAFDQLLQEKGVETTRPDNSIAARPSSWAG